MHFLPAVHISPELILLIFLPALLFEAAWNLELDTLRKNLVPVVILAVVGVVVSVGVVGAILHVAVGLRWPAALLFGAMISATDPVSVLALFRRMGLPPRLTAIVENESLFNDGTSIAVFQILLGIAMGTTAGTTGDLALLSVRSFLVVSVGGMVVGAVVGLLASTLTAQFDDHLLEITLTTTAAYGVFLLADSLHVSPVIAVLITGLIIGNYGRSRGMSATTQLAVSAFWDYAAFVVNSLVFLLIGLETHISQMADNIVPIAWAVAAMLAGRAVAVYGLLPAAAPLGGRVPRAWQHVLVWGGLRGSLSIALVLSLPTALPGREQLVAMIFGTVTFSLLGQGLTLSPLLRRLTLGGRQATPEEQEVRAAAGAAARGHGRAGGAGRAAAPRHRDRPDLRGGPRQPGSRAPGRAAAPRPARHEPHPDGAPPVPPRAAASAGRQEDAARRAAPREPAVGGAVPAAHPHRRPGAGGPARRRGRLGATRGGVYPRPRAAWISAMRCSM